MKTGSLLINLIFFSDFYASAEGSSILHNITGNSSENEQISKLFKENDSSESNKMNSVEKTQEDLALNNFVERLNDKMEVKFDEATGQLNSINHKMNMLDDRVNIKLKKLSNVIDEVDQRLNVVDNEINQKFKSKRLTDNNKASTPRPHRKWGRTLLKYWMLFLLVFKNAEPFVRALTEAFEN